jgi:hypothetical protein
MQEREKYLKCPARLLVRGEPRSYWRPNGNTKLRRGKMLRRRIDTFVQVDKEYSAARDVCQQPDEAFHSLFPKIATCSFLAGQATWFLLSRPGTLGQGGGARGPGGGDHKVVASI